MEWVNEVAGVVGVVVRVLSSGNYPFTIYEGPRKNTLIVKKKHTYFCRNNLYTHT